jgi:hypothetical protein
MQFVLDVFKRDDAIRVVAGKDHAAAFVRKGFSGVSGDATPSDFLQLNHVANPDGFGLAYLAPPIPSAAGRRRWLKMSICCLGARVSGDSNGDVNLEAGASTPTIATGSGANQKVGALRLV